ncbi:hypothetical protein [Flammeovirga pacifica]|uniref:Uncharacterized protein n=1 Tax=Flammeovirga pacifica TaxID=915059 RepID=A0A1S1YXD1_FLAPC|nr:hypothetical protein [Flammeovirga pacifica]OHX65662.1 hypothetical protein NH26_04520 [Flammeovirga pacifica]
MKNYFKSIFLGLFVLIGAFSCDPLKDIRDQIGNGVAPTIIDYELLEGDYELSCNPNVVRFGSFSDQNLPQDDTCGLAQIINQKFFGTDGDIMNATYKFYTGPIRGTVDTVSALKWKSEYNAWEISPVYTFTVTEDAHVHEYTLTDADYASQGESYPNFDSRGNTQEDVDQKIANILNSQTEFEIKEGDVVKVNYATYPANTYPSPRNYKASL